MKAKRKQEVAFKQLHGRTKLLRSVKPCKRPAKIDKAMTGTRPLREIERARGLN